MTDPSLFWFQEKTELNLAIDELCRLRDQLPSVHSESVPIGEGVEVYNARRHMRAAIACLEPLRRYKKQLPC